IVAGLERAPRLGEMRELLRRRLDPGFERARVPVESGVAALHGLVDLETEAPVEVEAVDLMPVPLAERVGEAAADRPAGVDADQVLSLRGCDDFFRCRVGGNEPAAPLARGGVRRLVEQEPGVLGHIVENAAKLVERRTGGVEVFASERERGRCLAALADQPQRNVTLLDASRLAHLAAVETHEVGALAGEFAKQHLAGLQNAAEPLRELEEPCLHRRRSRSASACFAWPCAASAPAPGSRAAPPGRSRLRPPPSA